MLQRIMQKNPFQDVVSRVLRELVLHNQFAPGTSGLAREHIGDQFVDINVPLAVDVDRNSDGIAIPTQDALSKSFILAAGLFNLFPDRDVCEGDSGNEDDEEGFARLFRSGGEGHVHMNKELFERLELGEKFDVEDFLLLSTMMGQQQDPNTMNLLNVVILTKLLGRGGGGRGLETALLLTQFMNSSSQAASGGTGVQAPLQNSMLPILLALTLGRGEEVEGFRSIGRRGWKEKEEYPEVPEKKQPRQ